MATKGRTKKTPEQTAEKKAVATRSRVRQATVKEASAWLNQTAIAAGSPKFSRLVTAIRDPKDAHRLITIIIHE